MLNGRNRVNYCVTDLVPHLCSAPNRGPDWVPAVPPYPALCVPGLAHLAPAALVVVPVAPAALAVVPLAAVVEPQAAASELFAAAAEPPAVEEGCGFERVHHLVAVVAYVDQPERPAAVALDVWAPVVFDFSPEALPVFPAEQVRPLFVYPAAVSAGGLPCHAAGNGNSGCVASAAALPGGICLQNTVAGRLEAGHALEQSYDSTGPILFDAAPIHCPSADPSGAAHSTATHESIQEAADSSSRVYAG